MIDKKTYLLSLGLAISAYPILGERPVLRFDPDTNTLQNDTLPGDSLVIRAFRKQAVYNRDFVRNTFYTWTSSEQIEELRKNKTLLTRNRSKNNELSLFDMGLRDTAFSRSPIAYMLREDQFKNKRFGWTSAWATVMGWKREKYGDQLLKIVLDEKAIIGLFNENDPNHPFRFFYMNGTPVDENTVLRSRNKLAVMYHVSERKVKHAQRYRQGYTSYRKGKRNTIPFREFVILNESMVKSWSYGTPEILGDLQSEIDLLKKTSPVLQHCGCNHKYHMNSDEEFSLFENPDPDYEWFFRATCFEKDYYLSNPSSVNRIVRTLEKVRKNQGPAFSK